MMRDSNLIPRSLAPFDLYPYNPSESAAYAFVAVFGIAAAAHFVYMFPLRAWSFTPLILGCIGEAFGYYGRAWSHNNIRDGSPYLLQLMLILGSAPLLAATIYMSLGRFARALKAEEYTVIGVRWISKIYILIDIASFLCLMAGSAMQASNDASGIETGRHIVTIGLGVQLGALGWFIVETIVLHVRLNRGPTATTLKARSVAWRKYLWAVRCSSILIFIRSIYRLVEFTSGDESEVLLYVFDASLLSSAVYIFVLIHPGSLFRQAHRLAVYGSEEDGSHMLSEQS